MIFLVTDVALRGPSSYFSTSSSSRLKFKISLFVDHLSPIFIQCPAYIASRPSFIVIDDFSQLILFADVTCPPATIFSSNNYSSKNIIMIKKLFYISSSKPWPDELVATSFISCKMCVVVH